MPGSVDNGLGRVEDRSLVNDSTRDLSQKNVVDDCSQQKPEVQKVSHRKDLNRQNLCCLIFKLEKDRIVFVLTENIL